MTLQACVPPLGYPSAAAVLLDGYRLQMSGIDAASDSAEMIQHQSGSRIADEQQIGQAVATVTAPARLCRILVSDLRIAL